MDSLRYLNILFAIVGIVFWIAFALKYKRLRLYAVAPILYLLHVIVFYTARMFGIPGNDEFVSIWSSAIRLQSVITIVGGGVILNYDLKLIKH